ncbi:hypothetical protein L3Q82_013716, partial [Scortum barcoo]
STADMDKDARPSWDNPLQFVLACVSYAVGLGNVWRFPYLCQMHGGGGFLIPYLLMLFLEGVPLFYMELAIGQKMSLGSIGAWTAISPYLGGVGLASVVTSLYLCLYYNIINAWSFWYLFHSFQSVLPWAECPINSNRTRPVEECEKATPTQYFFYRETLDISSSIEENGGVHTGQALCLLLAWVITYLFIVRGVKSSGKVVYFTATFPYLVLIIYLIRGVTLHGAMNGVKYMFTPKMEQLANPTTWINAATQIFFSLGLGFGSLIAFASYNQYNNNFEHQAIIVSLINSGTSIFASIVTFSIYGFKATINYENCLERTRLLLLNTFNLAEDTITIDNVFESIEKLNTTYPQQFAELTNKLENCDLESELDTAVEGAGLAFIVYSEAIKYMPLSQLWSVLYFMMLLLLGMGSMLGNVTAIITPLRDFKVVSHLSNELLNDGGQSPDILVPGQQPPAQVFSKTKELIVDFRRRQREEHAPLSINGTTVERVSSFQVPRGSHQLRRLNMELKDTLQFLQVHHREYPDWLHHHGSCTALNRKALLRVVKAAQHKDKAAIHGGPLHPAVNKPQWELGISKNKLQSKAYQATEYCVLLAGSVCLFCLLLGLGFTTTSGNYWFAMFNDYGATFSLLFIVLTEVLTVSYIYGIKRFEKDIEDMLGHCPNWYWKIAWMVVSPLLLIALFIFYIINYIQGGTPTYQAWDKEQGKSVVTEYPVFGQLFIGLLLVSSVSCVPITALYVYCKKRKHGHHQKRQRTVSTVSA